MTCCPCFCQGPRPVGLRKNSELTVHRKSRSDAYFADPNPFNDTVWAETASYFTTEMITVDQLAKARMGRLATSQEVNPEHELSSLADGFSWGECASFFEIMADGTTGTVAKKFIEYWFRKLSCARLRRSLSLLHRSKLTMANTRQRAYAY